MSRSPASLLTPDVTTQIVLEEHSRSEPIVLPASARRALFAVAADRVRLLATPEPESVVLETGSWVGTISVPGYEVRIQPSVPMQSIFAMLGGLGDEVAWGRDSARYRQDGELLDGSALVVLRAIDAATRRGLVHGYRTREEASSTLRGRLLVDQLARQPWTIAQPVCRYDEFTPDVEENHLLRAAVRTVLGAPGLSADTRRLAVELLSRFDGVADVDARELRAPVTITRLNEHYEQALGLARMALDGFAIRHQEGDQRAHAFLVDVDLVFLRFVAAELRARLWPRLRVEQAEELALDDAAALRATADILVRDATGPGLVIGTRYHLSESERPPANSSAAMWGVGHGPQDPAVSVANDAATFFPVMVQAASLDLDSALVVYAHARRRPASRIRMPATSTTVYSWHVDLDRPWDELTAELDELAAHVQRIAR